MKKVLKMEIPKQIIHQIKNFERKIIKCYFFLFDKIISFVPKFEMQLFFK
jgi:hypothetical protein